jgi:uncharacterized protein YcnI
MRGADERTVVVGNAPDQVADGEVVEAGILVDLLPESVRLDPSRQKFGE